MRRLQLRRVHKHLNRRVGVGGRWRDPKVRMNDWLAEDLRQVLEVEEQGAGMVGLRGRILMLRELIGEMRRSEGENWDLLVNRLGFGVICFSGYWAWSSCLLGNCMFIAELMSSVYTINRILLWTPSNEDDNMLRFLKKENVLGHRSTSINPKVWLVNSFAVALHGCRFCLDF